MRECRLQLVRWHGSLEAVTASRRVLVLFLLGLIAAVVSGVAAAGGHGSYLPATLLFPFTILWARASGSVSGAALALALAQYPLYGWIFSRARSRGSLRHARFFLAMLHGLAAYASLAATGGGPCSP